MRILILDDEPWTVNWITGFVGRQGDVCIVSSFEEAVAFIDENVPDIVIIDVMIGQTPGEFEGAVLADIPSDWDGLKFLRHVRVVRKLKRNQTAAIVYSVLDDLQLQRAVEQAFQGRCCTKSDVLHFRQVLNEEIQNRT